MQSNRCYNEQNASLTDVDHDGNVIASNPGFQFNARNSGGYQSFTTAYQPLITGWARPVQGTTLSLSVDYKVTVPYNTKPGVYQNTIYTSTNPW